MPEHNYDELLDAALSTYLAAPPAGLADRVLNRTRRPHRWPYFAALAAAAALAIVALLSRATPTPPPTISIAHAAPAPPVHFTPNPVRESRPALTRLPLTPRERTLITFVQAHPELAREIFVEAPKQMAEPLAMKPVEIQSVAIEPLTIEPLPTGGE